MPTVASYIQTFVLAGLTVSGISYLGNEVNPLLAGILSGVPISIPSMLLIQGDAKQKKFIFAATILVAFLSVITFICWYLFTKLKYSANYSVFISFMFWLIGSAIYYYIVTNK